MEQREMTRKISACAFGALLAVLLVPAGVAQADQTDQDFNSFLQSHGINLGTAGQAVNMAHVMCQDLDAGYTEKDEVDQITGAHRLNQGQAQMFVGAATADYCPQHHPASKPSSK
jgi:opacity protein-like surface antigen